MAETTLKVTEPDTIPEEETTMVEFLERLKITDGAHLAWAIKAVAEVKDKHTEVKAERDSFVKPLQEIAKKLSDKYKPALDSLARCEKLLKDEVVSYAQVCDGERRRLLKEAEAGDDEAITKASHWDFPKIAGLSLRSGYDIEVEDQELLVNHLVATGKAELLLPNLKVLKEAAKSGHLGLPGVKVKPSVTVAITAAKVER